MGYFYQAEQEIIELRETLMEKKYSPDIIESVVENGQMVVDLLQFFIDKYSNKKWEDFIDWLYQLENVKSSAVTLSTIHKSKGAEATNVYILDSKKLPAIREPSQEWEKKQESNLQYVALSRSLENLYFVN